MGAIDHDLLGGRGGLQGKDPFVHNHCTEGKGEKGRRGLQTKPSWRHDHIQRIKKGASGESTVEENTGRVHRGVKRAKEERIQEKGRGSSK